MAVQRKKNVAGYVDGQGRFRPIRSPKWVSHPKRKATPRLKAKYSKAKAGDLGKKRQERALEDVFDREIRLAAEAAEAKKKFESQLEKEIARDIYGDEDSKGRGQTLMQFVRQSGGIRRHYRHGGKAFRGKRSSWDAGEINRLSYKQSGRRGLTTDKGGLSLDRMYQAAREAGFDVESMDDLISKVEAEASGGPPTYITHGSLDYRDNPSELRVMQITPKSYGVFLRKYLLKKFRTKAAAESYVRSIQARRKSNPAGNELGVEFGDTFRLKHGKSNVDVMVWNVQKSRVKLQRLDTGELVTWPWKNFNMIAKKYGSKVNPAKGKIAAGQTLTDRPITELRYRGAKAAGLGSVLKVVVLERKGQFAKVKTNEGIKRTKIYVSPLDGSEYIMPFGKYSMAPVFSPSGKKNPSAARMAKAAISIFDNDFDLDVDAEDLKRLEAETRKLKSQIKRSRRKMNPVGWFKDVSPVTPEAVKKLYKKLATKYHPDKPGGDLRTMQAINADYDKAIKMAAGNEGNAARAKAEKDAAGPLREAIEFAVTLPDDVEVVIRGLWLWVHGNTYAAREKIKSFVASDGNRFKWASKKKAWYFAAVPSANRGREMSVDEIEMRYGRDLIKERNRRRELNPSWSSAPSPATQAAARVAFNRFKRTGKKENAVRYLTGYLKGLKRPFEKQYIESLIAVWKSAPKANPINPIMAFAAGASGILSALQIKEHLARNTVEKAKGKTMAKAKAKANPKGLPVRANAADLAKARSLGKKKDLAGMKRFLNSKIFVGSALGQLWEAYESARKANPRAGAGTKAGGRSKANPAGWQMFHHGSRTSSAANASQWQLYNNRGEAIGTIFRSFAKASKTAKPRAYFHAYIFEGDRKSTFDTLAKAKAWVAARTKAKANPGSRAGKTAAARAKANPRPSAKAPARPARKNPKPPARRRTYEMFQGRPSTTAKEMPVSRFAPARLDQLGDLIELKLADGQIIKPNPQRFKLCAAGGKLWIVGGKFAKANPAGKTNELNPIARIVHVVYGTRKPHHGDHAYTHYIHKMGEDTGHQPMLAVDREGFPIIRGGQYKIEARGIVN